MQTDALVLGDRYIGARRRVEAIGRGTVGIVVIELDCGRTDVKKDSSIAIDMTTA